MQEQEPKQARSIYTTLDLDYQIAVEQALAEADHRWGCRRGLGLLCWR
ncbi:MAG: hypothetical protein R3D55_23370 [Chloroflexota bacterium]